MTTEAPSRAKTSEMPRPIPVPPPVTSATCPLSLTRGSLPGRSAGRLHDEGGALAGARRDDQPHRAFLDRDPALPESLRQRRQVVRPHPDRREGRLVVTAAERAQLDRDAAKADLRERSVLRGEARAHPEQVLEPLGRRPHVLDLA